MQVKEFLTKQEEEKVIAAIRTAEKATSGEIRVHFEKSLDKDCLERAKELFYYLEMQKTKDKNGVLFYVAVDDHQFAIIGDEGIDKVVPDDFWKSVKNIVVKEFTKGNNANGLVMGILEAGQKLQQYFPYQKDDINEISDEISKS